MNEKYSLTDDRSNLTIGYCKDILGLTGKINKIGGDECHKIILIDFYFCNEFKVYIKKNKESFNRLVAICILNKENIPIGKYYFSIIDKIYYHRIGFSEEHINMEINGYLQRVLLKEELEIWNRWKIAVPTKKNEWSKLDENYCRAWLNVVMKYDDYNKVNYNSKDEIFYLDGTYIVSYPSFFCALGEAINGPGGYYGFDLMSMCDCLCGGYGTRKLFTLVWTNYKIAQKKLDKETWKRDVKYRKNIMKKSLEDEGDLIQEEIEMLFFDAVVKTLTERGVKIIFE